MGHLRPPPSKIANVRLQPDTWKAIGAELNVDRLEVMKIIDTLTGQFRREVKKMKPKYDAHIRKNILNDPLSLLC